MWSGEGCKIYYMRAWANVKTQEKNVISSLLYTFSSQKRLKNPWALETTFCLADDFWTWAGFNGITALASHVLMVLQPRGKLEVGCNGILSQCDILTSVQETDNNRYLLQTGSFIKTYRYITMKLFNVVDWADTALNWHVCVVIYYIPR